MADTADRRTPGKTMSYVLKRELNPAQLATLHTLEQFGWELKFIRHGSQETAVLFDPDARRHAVLKSDGELDENPIFLQFR